MGGSSGDNCKLVPSLSFFSSKDVLGVRRLIKILDGSSSAKGGGASEDRPRKTEAAEARVGRSGGPAVGAGGGGGAAVLGT